MTTPSTSEHGVPHSWKAAPLSRAERVLLLAVGITLAISGMGLVATFGLLAFIGMPLLIVGLGCISGATAPISGPPR